MGDFEILIINVTKKSIGDEVKAYLSHLCPILYRRIQVANLQEQYKNPVNHNIKIAE